MSEKEFEEVSLESIIEEELEKERKIAEAEEDIDFSQLYDSDPYVELDFNE